MRSVVAMSHSVYAVAAAEFMAAFYEALFAGQERARGDDGGAAAAVSRKRAAEPEGAAGAAGLDGAGASMPAPLSFPKLRQAGRAAAPSFDGQMLDRAAVGATEPKRGPTTCRSRGSLARWPVCRPWRGVLQLERSPRPQRVVLIQGPGGHGQDRARQGLRALVAGHRRDRHPDWVFFHSFEPGLASFGLDGVLTAIGLKLFGDDSSAGRRDPGTGGRWSGNAERHRMLLIWDNFECVYSMADPASRRRRSTRRSAGRCAAFLAEVAAEGCSRLIITSRSEEDWLGRSAGWSSAA